MNADQDAYRESVLAECVAVVKKMTVEGWNDEERSLVVMGMALTCAYNDMGTEDPHSVTNAVKVYELALRIADGWVAEARAAMNN